jgi:hypothetical protein
VPKGPSYSFRKARTNWRKRLKPDKKPDFTRYREPRASRLVETFIEPGDFPKIGIFPKIPVFSEKRFDWGQHVT